LNIGGFGLFNKCFEGKGDKEVSIPLVELGLELNPVQAEGVEEGR
jgi:hypothetical protein